MNWLVIIPVDTTDVSGLPTFDAYEEFEDGVGLEKLAGLLNLDITTLDFYNG